MIPEIETTGSPYERGRQFGAATADDIHRLLGGIALDRASLAAHVEVIERVTPSIAEEIHGLAAGASISVYDAYLLQMRRELAAAAASDCSTFALAGRRPFLAQTIDLPG